MSDGKTLLNCIVVAAFLTFLVASGPNCTAQAGSGEEKAGLAALYPGDEGIERDPRVLFVEDFETGSPDEIGQRWGQIYLKENVSLSDDIPSNSPGYKSIHYKDNAYLYTHTTPVDTLYARFYVKFHEKTGYIHHFAHIPPNRRHTRCARPECPRWRATPATSGVGKASTATS